MRLIEQSTKRLAITFLIALSILASFPLPSPAVQAAAPASSLAAPQAETAVSPAILIPSDDARIQPGSPNTNFDDGFLWMGHPNVHFTLLKFDLSVLPADAVITAADLRLYFTGMYTGTNQVEVGRIDGAWEEETVTGSTPISLTWSSQFQTVTSTGRTDGSFVTWDVTPLVKNWHSGARTNDGLALRGNGGDLKAAHSKETGEASDLGPKLRITYTLLADDGQPRPDLGDAPDSTNHHGINNTAYLGGVLGQFPTVYNVPANQAAGPRHNNQSMEGWLGDFLSREEEADQGPDQDAPRNNILRNTDTGATGDVADNDRADDGWRNRTLRFFDCERTQLQVRVSKAPNATRNRMYLNVWFDGNRDGDWGDLGQCQRDEEQPAQASYEWIVQNYIIDMTAIPAGGSFDFNIPTERVFNSSGIGRHWMRFTLSEEVAVQPISGGLPDGRGPHPDHPVLKVFQYGETEDVVQRSLPVVPTGELKLKKEVINPTGGVVPIGGLVTYEITLKHEGGSQPIQARIRDELAYGFRLFPQIINGQIEYVVVTSPTGGAAPLLGQYRLDTSSGLPLPTYIVGWNGTLAPNAVVKLSFLVQNLGLCQPNQNTQIVTNIARARQPGAAEGVTAEATFTAACPGYNPSDIQFEETPIDNEIDLDDLSHYPWHGTVHNSHPISVTLGIYQRPLTGTVEASAVMTVSKPPFKLLDMIVLKPGETKPLDLALRLADESRELLTGNSGEISFCFLPSADSNCPPEERYPHLHGHAPFIAKIHPSDLGDAPDSTNHFNQPMAAYPNVPANYPTVFDPAAGQPQGPRHLHPRPFHLGERVSREIDADVGPDQDPLNNIEPQANDPDNDRADDGSRLRNLANCQPAAADVQVAIRPAAVAYFQQLGAPAYLNIWIDSNRDGDWADGFTCQDAQGQNHPVVEHILIDQPINVVGLGVGLHNLANIVTQRVLWPAQLANRPVWVRFTLSEQPANKPLNFGNIQYGDGRGYAQAFKVGETEDYYRYYEGNAIDLAVQLSGDSQQIVTQAPGLQAAAVDKLGNFEIQMFKIDVTNIGATGVVSALLEFQIPEKFHGQQPKILRAPGLATQSISFNFDKLSMLLPYIEQDNIYSVVLGWYGCITCTLANNVIAANTTAEYTGVAKVTANGDTDTSNNQSSATLRGLLSSPLIGAFMDYTDDSCMDHIVSGQAVTNRTSVQLRGRAAPNQIIAILIGLVQVGTTNSDGNGNFSFNVNLTQGVHLISAKYANQVQSAGVDIVSPRDPASGLPTGKLRLLVDPTLPYDPMSACFTDSSGKSIFAPTLGYNQAETLASTLGLKAGETYRISVYGNGNNPNSALDAGFTIADDLINEVILRDLDGDGLFTGQITLPDSIAATQTAAQDRSGVQTATADATIVLTLIATNGATESSHSSAVTLASDGMISNKATGQPIANAAVAALLAQTSDAGVIYSSPASSTLGQPNPATTAANGGYSFNVPNGVYRLDVLANGYQPYRSNDIEVTNGLLAQNLSLSPVIDEAATQRILITANGFQPATLTGKPGEVVEFVNIDLVEHGVIQGNNWDSGILAPGQSYKVKLGVEGNHIFNDMVEPTTQGLLTVDEGAPNGGDQELFLPLVAK